MDKAPTLRFTPATTGADLLGHIKILFEVDRKVRKREIQAVAEVNANNFIQNELAELFSRLDSNSSLNTRPSGNDFEWLSEILSSVALDTEKLTRVENYLYKTYSSTIERKVLESLKNQTLMALEREFKKMRSLKQAYYYRNRSVKAIISFLESKDGVKLLRAKVSSSSDAAEWLSEVKDSFLNYDVGEKFSRNSYLSELEAFLHDSWSELTEAHRVDTDKSFSNRVKSAITGVELGSESSPQLSRAYQQLSSYYEGKVEQKSNARIDLVLTHGAVEFKAVKGEGLYAYYKPLKEDRSLLKDLEAQVLAASFDEEDLPDIGTQIVEKPGLLLVIKCLGKPSAATIKTFEAFVGRALN
jgi:hypothetical protein